MLVSVIGFLKMLIFFPQRLECTVVNIRKNFQKKNFLFMAAEFRGGAFGPALLTPLSKFFWKTI